MRCWLQKEPARKLPNVAKVPTLVVTSEASYHATYDHCTAAYLTQAGVKNTFIRLADRGVNGNGHMMMLEKNNMAIAGVMAEWLDGVRDGVRPVRSARTVANATTLPCRTRGRSRAAAATCSIGFLSASCTVILRSVPARMAVTSLLAGRHARRSSPILVQVWIGWRSGWPLSTLIRTGSVRLSPSGSCSRHQCRLGVGRLADEHRDAGVAGCRAETAAGRRGNRASCRRRCIRPARPRHPARRACATECGDAASAVNDPAARTAKRSESGSVMVGCTASWPLLIRRSA